MDRNKLTELLSTTLLWEVVVLNIEKKDQLSIMLYDIDYIQDKDNVIMKVEECEVLDSEGLDIIDVQIENGDLLIDFEMEFILSVWSGKQQLLRITATAVGKCKVAEIDKYDWWNMKLEDMGKEELLANKELVHILKLNYIEVECDEVMDV